MFLPRKIYCRVFQEVFHMAIPFLPYRKPALLHHTDALVPLLGRKGISRILLVTDPVVRGNQITQPLEQSLKQAGISCIVYDQTVSNPTTDQVEEARALYNAHHCQAIIGFGGGSSMDCAKAVGAGIELQFWRRIARPRKTLDKMEGILQVWKKLPLLISIPTTAGTGSETTLAAVITDSRTRHKYPINDFVLIPRYAVLDPEVTRGLPPAVTATTGMDALTHAVEAFIGGSTTKETRHDAISAVKLIFTYLPKAYADGNDMNDRRHMLHAAYFAGNAFSKSYVGYVHAVAHSLGGRYNTPHGLANAVLLPYVLQAYGRHAYRKLHRLAVAIGISDPMESHRAGAEKFIQAVRDLQDLLDIPRKLLEIRAEDIPSLAKKADHEANPLYPVPKLMNAKELQRFYYDIMED